MTEMTWEQAVEWLRNSPNHADLVRACYYDDPLLDAAERFWQSSEWKATSKLIPQQKGSALDLGSGRGISSYALAKDGWSVSALEPDPSNLVGAGAIKLLSEESGFPIQIISQYSENLPFADNSFDLVYCRQALHHARDLSRTCSEIARVLKSRGRMVATREHVISKSTDLKIFLKNHTLHRFYGGENAYLLGEYTSFIEDAGLRIDKVFAPYDTIINYFPMSEADWLFPYRSKLEKLFGVKFATTLLSRGNILGSFLIANITMLKNHRNQIPGRLYSFVAQKEI